MYCFFPNPQKIRIGTLLIPICAVLFSCDPQDQAASEDYPIPELKPWEYSLDSMYALSYPDRYAWDLFRAINWPADTVNLLPDTSRVLGDPGWVVWQTWKTAPNIYLPDGSEPAKWEDKQFGEKSLNDFSSFSIKEKLPNITQDPTYGLEEVAMNKSSFDYLVQNELYNLNGQLAVFNSDQEIAFPTDGLEIKVKWRIIADTDYNKARYHWQYITVEDQGKEVRELYGLVAIHVTSRVLKKWLWATFEHVDSRSQKHEGDDGWLLPSRDSFACPDYPYDCERAPTNIGLEGNKWEYFLLRGTQTDYFDQQNRVSLLANSNVERGFQLSSSCITCHSLATIGPIEVVSKDTITMTRIDFLPQPPFKVNGVMFGGKGYVGVPDTSLFRLKDSLKKMKQSDFAWSLSRAAWNFNDSTTIKP